MSGIVSVIVVSSDDEEPSPKRMRKEVKPNTEIDLKVDTKKISSTNIVVIDDDDDDDVVICIGDEISEEKTTASLNNEIFVKPPVKKTKKRVELTTLSPKIVNETPAEFEISSNVEKCISAVTVAQIDDPNKASFQDVVSSSGIPAEEEASKEEREFIPEFNDFIETCSQCVCDKKYKDAITKKIPRLMEKYMALDQEFVNSKRFKKILQYSIEKIKRKPSNVIIHFNDVYQELRVIQVGELTEKQTRYLATLNRAMSKVHKRIQRLEAKDAELDDDTNSGFIMVARYHERLCSIYKKICDITGESYHSSRHLYKNLDMNSSKYQVINKAVDRLYSKTKVFPSYYDIDKCVRESVERNNLKISEAEIELETQKLFRDAGDIIQRRRKYELFENMYCYTENEPEPDDKELEDLMNTRLQEREKQISKIIDDYTYKQTIGVDVTVSPDSEDSNLQSEEESD